MRFSARGHFEEFSKTDWIKLLERWEETKITASKRHVAENTLSVLFHFIQNATQWGR